MPWLLDMQSATRHHIRRDWLHPHILLRAANHTRPIRSRHATSTSSTTSKQTTPHRKAITIANDTGQVPWTDLSSREKASRGTQQSLNLLVILAGLGLTLGVASILWLEVFSPDSKTAVFNHVVDRVRADKVARDVLLGPGARSGKIEAHGGAEGLASRWDRNREITSTIQVDGAGVEHLYMHFHVSGPANKGLCRVHMIRRPTVGKKWTTHSISVDVPAQPRIWIERAEAAEIGKKSGTIFGVRLW